MSIQDKIGEQEYSTPYVARKCETVPSHTNDFQSWNVWGREVTVMPESFASLSDDAAATQWITISEQDIAYLEDWA